MTVFVNKHRLKQKETQMLVSERFFKWVDQNKKTLVELAGHFGTASNTLTNWRTRGIPSTQWSAVAALMGTPVEVLTASKGNVSVLTGKYVMLPLINSVHAGSWTGIADDSHEEFMPVYSKCSSNSFCLRVEGESMTPTLEDGDIVVVDPDISPSPGKCVVACKGTEEYATVKRYRALGLNKDGCEVIELMPDNKMFASYRSDETEIRIIGVVIAVYRNL